MRVVKCSKPNCRGQTIAQRRDAGSTRHCELCGAEIPIPLALFESEKVATRRSVFDAGFATLCTLLFHVGVLTLLGIVYWGFSSEGSGGELGGTVTIGSLPESTLTESNEPRQLDAAAETPEIRTEELAEAMFEVAPLEIATSANNAPSQAKLVLPSGGGGEGGGIGGGTFGGGGSGLGVEANFMGLSARGNNFCIIADNSGSMSGEKLQHVKTEILETLDAMKGGARFCIVFFNSSKDPYPGVEWARRNDRGPLESWVRSRTSTGGTNPKPAFDHVFGMEKKPDVIFFMTDGAFPPNVADQVAALNAANRRKIPVNTISFVSNAAESLLRRIAEDSGGQYRHVPGF